MRLTNRKQLRLWNLLLLLVRLPREKRKKRSNQTNWLLLFWCYGLLLLLNPFTYLHTPQSILSTVPMNFLSPNIFHTLIYINFIFFVTVNTFAFEEHLDIFSPPVIPKSQQFALNLPQLSPIPPHLSLKLSSTPFISVYR